MGSKVLTQEEREQIAFEYMDSWISQRELAEKWGVNQSTICRVLNETDVLDMIEKKASTSARRAKIRAQLHSDEIMRMQIEDARNTRQDKYGHLHQNARRDILDRAGVREVKAEDNTLNVNVNTGDNGLTLGLPKRESTEK